MKNLNNEPSVVTGEGGDGEIEGSSTNEKDSATPSPPANPSSAVPYNHPGIWYLIYVGILIIMYPSLIGLTQLKFENKNHTPFETHTFFANMAVAAYIIAVPTSMVLFYINTRLESSIKERFSPIYYKILISIFYLSGILAPLSFVLVLFIPHRLNWIGYSIICVLFVVTIGSNFIDYKKLLGKKQVSNMEAFQKEETSPHSIIAIDAELKIVEQLNIDGKGTTLPTHKLPTHSCL